MYDVSEHICAHVKQVYSMTIDFLQSMVLSQCALRIHEREISYVCYVYVHIDRLC